MKKFILLSLALVVVQILNAQSLRRRAHIGAAFSGPNPGVAGVVVTNVVKGSAFEKAGIKTGDRILRLNNELLDDANRWSDIEYDLRGGDRIRLEIMTSGKLLQLTVELEPLPKESFPGTNVIYGEVMSSHGDLIRTIITHPSNAGNDLPALFVVGGLSCSSIEVYPGRPETGWTKVLRDISTKSNMVVMRVEKPGVGDSNGHCGESDLLRDLAAFEAAYESLKGFSLTDTSKIIIYGSSMGSALAPHLANKLGAAGVISDGTFVKTWFEHMLEIERRIRLFEGDSPSEVDSKLNKGYIPLYYGMLIEKKSYQEVIKEKPYLSAYNYHSPRHMYGRPVKYYHQVQDFNFAKAWEEIKVPVRILRGTNDWIMSEEDNYIIMDILKRSGHQDHQLYLYEGLDHWNKIHENAIDSYQGKPGKWEDRISQIIIDFAQEIAGSN